MEEGFTREFFGGEKLESALQSAGASGHESADGDDAGDAVGIFGGVIERGESTDGVSDDVDLPLGHEDFDGGEKQLGEEVFVQRIVGQRAGEGAGVMERETDGIPGTLALDGFEHARFPKAHAHGQPVDPNDGKPRRVGILMREAGDAVVVVVDKDFPGRHGGVCVRRGGLGSGYVRVIP